MKTAALLLAWIAATASASDSVPASVKLVPEFSLAGFHDPEAVLWPAYFWLWNAPLDEGRLRAQLRDMAAHDARSVCVLPMPHGFRPDSTNNSLDPDYLTDAYLARVRDMVQEAARLKMAWWLYDEGGWPSGQALGKVVEGRPDLVRRTVARERVDASAAYTVPADVLGVVVEQPAQRVVLPGETWTPSGPDDVAYAYRVVVGGGVDLLNPDATQRFLEITHEAYARVLSEYFGNTIPFTFTDEPSAGMPRPPDSIPWTAGVDALFAERHAHAMLESMPEMFAAPAPEVSAEVGLARIELYDTITHRFDDAYFVKLKTWCREHNLASAGHLGGEDETFGAVMHGFGHLLRPLRSMDVPGVDLIWRQLFPGRENQSNFPVAAPSAAHQNGTRFAFSESFCVYGNGLTPAQMKWLADYQYIRGINLFVIGCFPLSTEDHHMTGERPHFGAMDPLWDHLPGFHAYIARLGYTLSVGSPAIRTALYYPVRDLWALGLEAKSAAATYEALGAELMARQCPYDLIDDDMLTSATVDAGALVAGAMRYDTIVCGDVRWMHPDSLARLKQFAEAGGKVLCVDHAPGTTGEAGSGDPAPFVAGAPEEIAGHMTPLVALSPESRDVRVAGREVGEKRIVVLFNEGNSAYDGQMAVSAVHAAALDLERGSMAQAPVSDGRIRLRMEPGETKAFLLSGSAIADAPAAASPHQTIAIEDAAIRATACKQISVGEHNFEIAKRSLDRVPFLHSATWKPWLGEDYSGEVDYEFNVEIPAEWAGSSLLLETGSIEYAATVYLDGVVVGRLLWPPWRATLPACEPGEHRVTIRVANTLVNELTSERVTTLWSERKGPGWPSPYHVRALEFEKESRGGGISGPIRITRLANP
ncbi:MAG: glycosyl hydrolase [Candidatus Hydrogenedentales bacterium]|jgi:hypothetical protein